MASVSISDIERVETWNKQNLVEKNALDTEIPY